jgi:hypothetical protein
MHGSAQLLPDGRVLVVGGEDPPGTPSASAELYDPATGKFSPTGSMSTGRSSLASALLSDGRVLIAGGWNFNAANIGTDLKSAELYDPKTGTFAATGSMPLPCSRAADLANGRVLIFGCSDGTTSTTSAELYDPKTGKFAATGSMSAVQRLATATLLSDGRVLIAGGFDPDQNALATAELFEP